ncbi:MAG TPA: hypothetical protein VFB13_03710 [Reyranella sp.]|jgi:hypothetical protein|nr:hypothetical protein [Reyranella sp.]
MKGKRRSKRKTASQPPPGNVVVPFITIPKLPETKTYPFSSFKFRLRNGFVGVVEVPEAEADRLWYSVQQPDDFHNFVVFEGSGRYMALNLRHVVASQFDLIGEDGLQGTDLEPNATVDIYFADSPTPLVLEVYEDTMTIEEFDVAGVDDNDLCQIANLFHYFEYSHDGFDVAERLRTEDGSIVWLRIHEISFASVPIGHLKKASDTQPVEKAGD